MSTFGLVSFNQFLAAFLLVPSPANLQSIHKIAQIGAPKLWFSFARYLINFDLERRRAWLSPGTTSVINSHNTLTTLLKTVVKNSRKPFATRGKSNIQRYKDPEVVGDRVFYKANDYSVVKRPMGEVWEQERSANRTIKEKLSTPFLPGDPSSAVDAHSHQPYHIFFYFIFHLHQNFRLKFAFKYLHIIFPFDRYDCVISYVSITYPRLGGAWQSLKFCGVKSNFVAYSHSNDIQWLAVVKNYVYFNVSFGFSVIDRNLIETLSRWQRRPSEPGFYWHLCQKKEIVFSDHIMVSKYKLVHIKTKAERAEIFDGPGTKCKMLSPTREGSDTWYYASTFQCVVYLWQLEQPRKETVDFYSHKQWKPLAKIMTAGKGNLTCSKTPRMWFLSIQGKMSLHVPFKACPDGSSPMVMIYLLSTMNINLTITHFNLSLKELNVLCHYAGLTAIDGSTMTELSSFCMPSHNTEYQYRPAYSLQNSLLVSLFSYWEYTDLVVDLEISQTECKPVRMNSCSLTITALKKWAFFPHSPQSDGTSQMGVHMLKGTACLILQFDQSLKNLKQWRYGWHDPPSQLKHLVHFNRVPPHCNFERFFFRLTGQESNELVRYHFMGSFVGKCAEVFCKNLSESSFRIAKQKTPVSNCMSKPGPKGVNLLVSTFPFNKKTFIYTRTISFEQQVIKISCF